MATLSHKSSRVSAAPTPLLAAKHSTPFFRGAAPHVFRQRTATRQFKGRLEVQNFKFLKDLGLKKPDFLPDFGKDKRKALLDRVFGTIDPGVYEEALADSFTITEGGEDSTFPKQAYINLISTVLSAVPDFTWAHATDGSADKEGYSIVTVQATGHHTGGPFALGNLPPVPPSGKHFMLAPETIRVKVEGGKIQQMVVLPCKGAGPQALYDALAQLAKS